MVLAPLDLKAMGIPGPVTCHSWIHKLFYGSTEESWSTPDPICTIVHWESFCKKCGGKTFGCSSIKTTMVL